jgi:hypothetical protein
MPCSRSAGLRACLRLLGRSREVQGVQACVIAVYQREACMQVVTDGRGGCR